LAIALSTQPDIEIVGSSPDGPTGQELFDDTRTDVLLLWVPWRERPFEQVTLYRRQAPTTRIVGLSTHVTIRNQMLAAGVDAIVDEADGVESLLAAIRQVATPTD
jgi:DNA-binding NarL/FixJ family response regulator